MDKLYLKNGKEVHIGDTISHCTKVVDPLFGGRIKATVAILITEANLQRLLEAGILMKKCQVKDKVPMDIAYYVGKLASRMGCKPERISNFLNDAHRIYPRAAFSIILREIAIELDKAYDDHIKDSPEIFVVSSLDGRITKVNKAVIKNYRNFAAFRSIEDAKIACKILREVLRKLYAKG